MTFEQLTPDHMLNAVETAIGKQLTGFTSPLPSYINRVYELRAIDGSKIIAKFYRHGRWSREAILDEHRFVQELYDAEIPVIPPEVLTNGETLGAFGDSFFAIFPKRAGRQMEMNSFEDWLRLGSLVARIHNIGALHPASNRIHLSPEKSTRSDLDFLNEKVIPAKFRNAYSDLVKELVDIGTPLFSGSEVIRIHGDLHRGNILDRLEEGLLIIDFDDMLMGPPVQDLWLLLPDRLENSHEETELFIEGYEQFREFDRKTLQFIEPLRAMRMVYFLAWCSRQVDDNQFKRNFPDWGNDLFWKKEINDLSEQLGFVKDCVKRNDGNY